MAEVKIAWTRLAINDLDSARDYVAAESPSSARWLIERIELAADALRKHPRMGRLGRVEGTRELVVGVTPFIVAYRIRGKRVEVLAVIHGARRWPDSF